MQNVRDKVISNSCHRYVLAVWFETEFNTWL